MIDRNKQSRQLIRQAHEVMYLGLGAMAGGCLHTFVGLAGALAIGFVVLLWAVACALSAAMGHVEKSETTGARAPER